ncbi:MAG TPA: translation initiation factor IF-2, partial [Acidimicrobiales bacterium]|nr:translation initiation factor IF-2 [Acidimicrobiales bacterium]
MPKKIRVYELARELGLTNKEALDLCVGLGIGVKSHSSSIEDAQADRVRRKAEREGLRRDVQPEEPAAPRKSREAPAPAAPERFVPSAEEQKPAGAPTAAAPAPEVPATPSEAPIGTHEAAPGHRLFVSRPASELAEQRAPQRPAAPAPSRATPPRPSGPPPSRPAPGPRRAEGEQAPAPAPRRPEGEQPPAPAPRRGEGEEAPAASAQPQPSSPSQPAPRPPAGAGDRPVSPSGRPIPPPPRPLSLSGKPIPPPPGMRRPPGPQTGGRPGAPGQPRGTQGAGGAGRPGTGARPPFGGGRGGAGRPAGTGGGFGGARGGTGGFPGRGGTGGGFGGARGGPGAPAGGLRGGPAGRGRPPQRRRTRRRRNMEELEPIQVATYVPSNAPVPDNEVIVERGSTPQQLGPKLNRSAGDVVRFLLLQGEMVTATQALTDDMIELFAAEIGARIRLVDPGEEQEAALRARYFGDDEEEEDEGDLRPRPPVVTVMGHVDHGKTLLLDRIRSANVVAGEAGGITQHIGAYQTDWNGHLLTFIDTPGHEAFTAMRARGASLTDIVVLVVAADDGVMPQTVEAINHARAADAPIVVAINKIDREDADPNRVMQQLSEHGLVPEAWGGDTITVEISALQSLGIDDLLEQLVVLAEVLELRANPEGEARGVVLEANLDVGRGPVATVIVERGTLRVGDPIVAGPAWGRVKAMINDRGDQVKEAPPSTPVQVLGLSEPPIAGDELRVTNDLSIARNVGEAREQRLRFASFAQSSASSAAPGARLEDLFEQISRGESATL